MPRRPGTSSRTPAGFVAMRSASDAYVEAHARGRDPQPGRALLQLRAGDAPGAAKAIKAAIMAAGSDPLRRAPLCAAAVDIFLSAGAIDDARASAAELERTAATYPTSGLEAMKVTAQGSVLLAGGNAEGALPVLRAACQRWLELAAPIEAARVCERLAEAYESSGDDASAAAELERAQATYRRLGLRAAELPGGLSRREAEVLALIAAGRSNREIAEEACHQRPHSRPAPDEHLPQDRRDLTHAGRPLRDRPRLGDHLLATQNRVVARSKIGQSRRCRRWASTPSVRR